MAQKTYIGLEEDLKQGLGPTAKIILDAKVFAFIDDAEDCAGWDANRIQVLYDKVSELKDKKKRISKARMLS